MLVTRMTHSGLFLNILYGYLVLFLVFVLYNVINIAAIRLTGAPEDQVILGVEPVLFGLFYLGFDLLLIKLKHALSGKVRGGAKNRSNEV